MRAILFAVGFGRESIASFFFVKQNTDQTPEHTKECENCFQHITDKMMLQYKVQLMSNTIQRHCLCGRKPHEKPVNGPRVTDSGTYRSEIQRANHWTTTPPPSSVGLNFNC